MKTSEQVVFAAEMIRDEALEKLESGSYQKYLGVEGHLALLVDKIQRWFETRDESELISLAADCLFAYVRTLPQGESKLAEMVKKEESRRNNIVSSFLEEEEEEES